MSVTSPTSVDPPPSGNPARGAEGIDFRRHPVLLRLQFFLEGFGEGLFFFRPGGHADELDVLLNELGRGLVGVGLMGGGDEPRGQEFGSGGEGAGLGAIEDALEHLLDPLVAVADVIPDAGLVGDDVRRLAAFDDHVVHPVGGIEMLAEEIRGDVHDLDARPGRFGRPRRWPRGRSCP